jgi:serine/threonine protein kinase
MNLASHPHLPPGTVIEGLRIEEVIGQGGMGTVYRATDRTSNSLLAIKIINNEKAADRKAVRRFEQEARLLARLRHPNIVHVHAIGRLPDGRYYYTMEYLDGLSLSQHIRWYGALSLDEVIRILAQVAAALDAAHDEGAVHRDVKPGNIFLIKGSSPGDPVLVKLLDFGIAKLQVEESLSLDTSTDTVAGSPFYMSPEQCRGKEVDHRSDIYSLGLVAYEMLTGRKAFDATTLGELLLQQQTKRVHLPSQGSVRWPPTIEAALQRALHKDPARRYHRASELVAELTSAMDNIEVGWESSPALAAIEQEAGPDDFEERVSFSKTKTVIHRQPSRWRIPVVAGSVALLGLAGIGFAVLAPSGDEPEVRVKPSGGAVAPSDPTTRPAGPTVAVKKANPRQTGADAGAGASAAPKEPDSEVDRPPASQPDRPRRRRPRWGKRKRRKRAPKKARAKSKKATTTKAKAKTNTNTKTKTKTKKDVVPGMPFRF